VNDKDRLSGKYYFQSDPTTNPFSAQTNSLGFPQRLNAGSQVATLENTLILRPNLTWEQRAGFTRVLAYSGTEQAFTPANFGINLFGETRFPGMDIYPASYNPYGGFSFGPATNFADAGFYQNQWEYGTAGEGSSLMKVNQWGIAPRLGIAWTPLSKLTVRSGIGLYYDRGEFFSEFSPSAGNGYNGPFGVTLAPPFINPVAAPKNATLENPFGATPPPAPPLNPAAFLASLPNAAGLINGNDPFLFGGYDPSNKLPYSVNWTFNLQYQPTNSLVLSAAYVGNHGVHEVLPIPFNQPGIATPQNPINGQTSSYGYNVNALEPISTATGGNTDLRALVAHPG
jgi:hypothetical protein